MAKGTSLFSTLSGKVGNVVAARIPNAADARRQSVRSYQPVVSNPKSYAQAEQRAKYMPLMKLYQVLKPIILRSQENKAYGAPSRYAWISEALKKYDGAWFSKCENVIDPPLVPLTYGSLPSLPITSSRSEFIEIPLVGDYIEDISQFDEFSRALLDNYPFLHEGDQLTICGVGDDTERLLANWTSFIIDTHNLSDLPEGFNFTSNTFFYECYDMSFDAGCIIISRMGSGGQHLRNTTSLYELASYSQLHKTPEAKDAAIRSYMSSSNNSDWAQQTIT